MFRQYGVACFAPNVIIMVTPMLEFQRQKKLASRQQQ
jgi:hypothetical protein